MPSAAASLGPVSRAGSPSQKISPESTGWIPAMHLTSVDLPAPLSPTRAVTSPRRTVRSTSCSTCTGPKLLLTALSSRIGVVTGFSLSPDAELLADGGRVGHADLGRRDAPGVHDLLDIVLGDQDGSQQHRLDRAVG